MGRLFPETEASCICWAKKLVGSTEDGDRLQIPKRLVLNKGQVDG
jgi:hypothetical protein